jgi:hypothetical protein
MKPSSDNKLPFVLLEGIKHGNRFITSNTPGEDVTKLRDGTVAYRVLGYAKTIEDAQANLFDSPAQKTLAYMNWGLNQARLLRELHEGRAPSKRIR